MYKLMEGIVSFAAGITATERSQFAQLALGQSPDAVFVGCADSRVDPRIFASKDPGDVFVTRNVGNLVPPNGAPTASPESAGTLAVIEYALLQLKVSHVIVCGHSECGAMQAVWNDVRFPEAPHLEAWLQHGRRSLERLRGDAELGQGLAQHNRLSQINVLQQLDHLRLHPLVRDRMELGALQLHGWWFDIASATVYDFDADQHRFAVLDRQRADRILERAEAVRKLA